MSTLHENVGFRDGSLFKDTGGGGGGGEWTDAGTYIYPTDGASKGVSIGTLSAPVGTEKLRVEGAVRTSYIVFAISHPEGGSVELRDGGGSALPGNGENWGKASTFRNVTDGRYYINQGTSASTDWVLVGTQS
jgi:hypothetical protein